MVSPFAVVIIYGHIKQKDTIYKYTRIRVSVYKYNNNKTI